MGNENILMLEHITKGRYTFSKELTKERIMVLTDMPRIFFFDPMDLHDQKVCNYSGPNHKHTSLLAP